MYLSVWTAACFWGPAIGPLVAGFAVQAKGFRWGLWEIVWLTGPILVVFLFAYPETSADNILRRRAHRLRKLTGNSKIKSQSEIDQQKMRASEIFWDAIIKPIEITIKDPAVGFTNLYVSGWSPDELDAMTLTGCYRHHLPTASTTRSSKCFRLFIRPSTASISAKSASAL